MTDTAVGPALLTPEQVCSFAGGRMLRQGRRDIRGVVADSRQVEADFLFVALPGQRVDGHAFLRQAVERQAAAILCTGEGWARNREGVEAVPDAAVSVIQVEDTLQALQSLAKAYIRRFPDLLRIGVTGSNGKTTTKEILGSILDLDRKTVISQGNLNSEIGLPLSCFRVRDEQACAVFEMGINHAGEMDVLADIYRPDMALITNIGSAHVGLLGSRRAIAREKRKIFRFFDGRQTAFLYEEEEFAQLLSQGVRGTIRRYGPTTTPGFRGSEDLGLDGTILYWEGLQIRFPLFGSHNLKNALASISVSAELGISKETIKAGLERVRPLFGRSQILRGPVTVIQDCYNANPESFEQVFSFLRSLNWPGRKIGVLGSMKELGEQASRAHLRIGSEAAASGFQELYLFGEEMEEASGEIRESGFPGTVRWLTDIELLRSKLRDAVQPGDLVLIKGSRAAELERLLPDLMKE